MRVLSLIGRFWWLAVLGLAAFFFISGFNEWNRKPSEGLFYQHAYAPAVSFACTGRMQDIVGAQPPELAEFLSRTRQRADCSRIFPLPQKAFQREPRLFQNQIAGSLYMFGWIWKFTGPSWAVAASVAGAFKAMFFVGLALLGSLMMPRVAAIAVAAIVVSTDPMSADMLPQLRDFSKAAFFGTILYFLVAAYEAKGRREVVIAAASALLLCISLGFRQDLSLFLYMFTAAFLVKILIFRSWSTLISAPLFLGLVVLFNLTAFDFWSTLNRNVFHFYLLGQNSAYLASLDIQSDMVPTMYYIDTYVFSSVRAFAEGQGEPPPAWSSLGYDEVAEQASLLMLRQFPADAAAKAINAFESTLFEWVTHDPLYRILVAIAVSSVLLYCRAQRGLLLLVPVALYASLTFIQFHERHYFMYASLGMILAAGATWLAVEHVVARLRGSFKAGSFLAAIPLGLLVLVASLLLPLRSWQEARFSQLTASLSALPPTRSLGMPVPEPSNTALPFRADINVPSGHVARYAKLAFAGCKGPSTIELEYSSTNPTLDWRGGSISLPAGAQAVFLPILQEEGQTLLGLRMSEDAAKCFLSLDEISLPPGVYPGVYWTRERPDMARPFALTSIERRLEGDR